MTRLLVDAHVHLHPGVPVGSFLQAARTHLEASALRVGGGTVAGGWHGVLCLVESEGVDRFGELAAGESRGGAGGSEVAGWKVVPTAEVPSLRAVAGDGFELVLVAGRQLRVADRLEVLALGTRAALPEGGGLRETIARVREAGGVPVLPWGFGKWWGGRGRRVARALGGSEPGGLLLGDNGGRWRGGPTPALFREARSRGIGILAGSDPLPLRGEALRAGSYGSVLEIPGDPATVGLALRERPAALLRTRLGALRETPPTFGRRVGAVAFARVQLAMQLRRFA